MDALETSDYEPVDPRDGFLDMFSILTRWYSKDPFPIHKLERAFRRFSHPNTKETMDFIEKWIADMEDFIAIMSRTRDSDPQCYRSHFHLLQGFLDAGMVAAFSELPLLVKENSTDIGYRAVKVIKNMVEEIKDDRELGGSVRRMIRTGGFRKLSATLERSTILVRSVAVSCFREIYTRLGMGEDVSADTFGSWLHIFVGQFHQEKYKTLVEQWNEPNSLLKQELDRLYDNIEPANLEIQLRRWLQMNQHKALETALALFKTRTKPISRKYALEILQQNYSILRPLLDIVSEERPSWNITRETDSLAAKILMHLLRLSMDVIPNSELPLGCSDSEDKEEWNAAIACNTKLWSDGTALAALAKMRSKVLQEDIASLCRQLTGEVRDMSLKEQAYALNLNRGTLIVAQIRLLINATYLHNPTSAFLFALLPVAYKACERLPSALELQCDDLNEQYIMDSNSAIGGTEIFIEV